MGSRFLCKSLLQLNKTVQVLRRTQHVALQRNQWPSAVYGFGLRTQKLHVKVFDKDAGLDEQREFNKQSKDFASGAHEIVQTEDEPKKLKTVHKSKIEVTKEVYGNPDVFGDAKIDEEPELDPGDIAEDEYISNPTRRTKKLRTKEYAHLIKEHLNAKRLKQAIDVLEQRMIKEDRVKPENYIYNLLISGCAKAGYTRKAFSLFTKMRQRGLKVTGGTYTSLFSACANAPSAADGLSRANHLREIMLEKGYEPNVVNYNAMIKAYGRCGDVKTAYLLADEMLERNLEVNASTFNFLLQACASDTEYGFRHCLLTWHKMLQSGIQPDYYSFSTVLRCVRDCNYGDLKSMEEVLQQILHERQSSVRIAAKSQIQLETASANVTPNDAQLVTQSGVGDSLQISTTCIDLEIPNLLAPQPHLGSLISIADIQLPHDRFLLLGGLSGFLEQMKQQKITPGIEMFTAMLEVIPPTNAAEKQLISFIRKIGLKSDIDFFNVLIKKRSMRYDYEGAKEVLSMLRTAGLHPDIVTYGVMALGCRTEEEARELLQQMHHNGIRLNTQILGAMLRQGCAQKNFPYVTEILQISLDEHVKPNDIFLRHLHNFYNQCARAIDARHPMTKTKAFKKAHGKFCDKLRIWYEEQGLSGLKLEDAIRQVKERPYQQYKEAPEDGMEPLKNEKHAKQNKVRKYIKKIKLENLRGDDSNNPLLSDQSTKRLD